VSFSGPSPTPVDVALEAQDRTRHVAVTLCSFLAVPHVLAESIAIALVPAPFGRRLANDGVIACKALPSEVPQPNAKMRMLWPASADRAAPSKWLRDLIVETTRSVVAEKA
jgi:DNA-binding transcriptional LysR family regulator